MKKIVIIIGILFCFQANVSICSEKPQEQTWWQRLSSLWKAIPAKAPAAGVVTGYAMSKGTPEFVRQTGRLILSGLDISWIDFEMYRSYEKAILGMGTVALIGFWAWYFECLDKLMQRSSQNIELIKLHISSALLVLLENERLYPTHESRLHALRNQEDLFNTGFYDYKLFQPTLNDLTSAIVNGRKELINKIDQDSWDSPYYYGKTKEEWKKYIEREKEIDKYISLFQQSIGNLSLEDKLNTLENLKVGKISEETSYLTHSSQVAAFESVYRRLKLKLEISRMLSKEEKQKLYGWKMQAQEAVSKLTPKD